MLCDPTPGMVEEEVEAPKEVGDCEAEDAREEDNPEHCGYTEKGVDSTLLCKCCGVGYQSTRSTPGHVFGL